HAPERLLAMADLVTEMSKIKHPYDQGRKALLGVDY
ncbi:MAG: cob(I)yrinic acid a,c-diamide adenosyltransferase, partial [Proteobacteria bacterium]|nr:cob(I)yrinic acid a,c-diamide adenosyltransferase [Pseudomonadota bacterium]